MKRRSLRSGTSTVPRSTPRGNAQPCEPRTTRILTAIGLILALAPLPSCANPAAIAQLHDQLEQAADAVNDIRVNMSTMQGTIDSLIVVAAKQDSIIVRLAAVTNVQIIK